MLIKITTSKYFEAIYSTLKPSKKRQTNGLIEWSSVRATMITTNESTSELMTSKMQCASATLTRELVPMASTATHSKPMRSSSSE